MDWILHSSNGWEYVALFLVLYISGAGVPIPEEFPLAAGGFLVSRGDMTFPGLVVCVALALVTGDLTAYWLGRHYGMLLMRVPPFRWVLSEAQLAKVKEKFRRHEGKTIFFGRFLAGIRLATFVFSGMAHVSVPKFVILDLLAACITAPIPVMAAYYLGDPVVARHIASRIDLVIGGVVIVGLIVAWAWYQWNKPSAPTGGPAAIEKSTLDVHS